MRARKPRRLAAGFTLTEILVVILILGILAAIGTPYMGGMIRVQRLKTAAFDVFSSLTFARSEAIKRNTTVTLTPTGGDWAKGWRISDANDKTLREQGGWETIVASGPATVSFSGTGRLAAAVTPIGLKAKGVDDSAYRCITLDLSGRATSKEGAC
jgi:type IV fimbrial biogenesis protein FimT